MARAVDEYLLVAKLLEDCPIMIVQRSGLFRTSVFDFFHKLVDLLWVAMRTEKCSSRVVVWGVIVERKEEWIAYVGLSGGRRGKVVRNRKKEKERKKGRKGDQKMWTKME